LHFIANSTTYSKSFIKSSVDLVITKEGKS
jgi:hypothetical protein